MKLRVLIIGKEWCWCFLNQLLVSALHRAIARGIYGEVSMRIAANLCFHVARLVYKTLNKVLVKVAALQSVVVHVESAKLVIVVHNGYSAAAAAIRALHHNWVAVRLRKSQQFSNVFYRLRYAWYGWHFSASCNAPRGYFIPQINKRFWLRANPNSASINHLLRKTRYFR